MKIYCVRHGEAENADVDPERPLTEQGREGIEKIARYMGENNIHIDALMHSPKLRAIQTGEIFAKYLSAEQVNECVTLLDEMNDVQPLVEMIPSWDGDTLLVGHLPFMYKLVSELLVGDANYYPLVNYSPGTVICLEYYNNERWIINWLLNPGMVN